MPANLLAQQIAQRRRLRQHRLAALPPTQVSRQVSRRRVPPRPVLFQAAGHDRFQVLRHARVVPPQALRLRRLDLQHQLRRRRLLARTEQRPQRQQFPQRRAQAVDVRPPVQLARRQHLFGTGVTQRAHELAGARQASLGLVGSAAPGRGP